MTITLSEQLPDKDEYFSLFITTGWNNSYQASPDDLERTNKNSWLIISAYDGDKLVGFGRVVTDFVLHAMIYDMIILPEYQGQGIGTMILKTLISKCKEQGIKDVQLFCAKGKQAFYEKNDVEARPEDAPGMQLKKRFFGVWWGSNNLLPPSTRRTRSFYKFLSALSALCGKRNLCPT